MSFVTAAASTATPSRDRTAGFTLTELVVVMVIAGILSVFAFSRMNTTSFNMEGFANQAAAMVRYAQKLAVNQRRTVVVRVCLSSDTVNTACPSSDNRLTLCYTDANCAAGAVHEPPGTSAFSHAVPSGVALSSSSTSFSFDALGKPTPAGGSLSITASGETTRTITIEAQTGYVRYTP